MIKSQLLLRSSHAASLMFKLNSTAYVMVFAVACVQSGRSLWSTLIAVTRLNTIRPRHCWYKRWYEVKLEKYFYLLSIAYTTNAMPARGTILRRFRSFGWHAILDLS
jgi:hypothetical protein